MIFKYPYTDLYNLNLDWVIQAIKEVQETITNLGTVVNTFNGQSGDVTLSTADIISIVGGIVNSFNGRSGAVTLTEADVNATLIDIVWTSDPGEVIEDLSQSTLNELFAAGRRVLIFNNALGEPDRIYFLTLVGDVVTPQQYIPTGAIAGVASVNGQTGAVTVRGDTIPVSGTDPTTVEDALAAKEDVLTFDQTPTAGSSNPVTSAGIQAADAAIRTDLTTLNNTVSGIDNRLESAEQGLTYAEQDISTLSQQIGDLTDLETTVKTDIVSAVNELHQQTTTALHGTFTPGDVNASLAIPISTYQHTLTQFGKIAFINISFTVSAGIAGYTKLFNMPIERGFPSSLQRCFSNNLIFYIDTNGDVFCQTALPAGNYTVMLIYITN